MVMTSVQMAGQTVGLVLSGGGSKGLAHIGVIRALEENRIPIDYIGGTSMGAIVGGLYALGMTPDEMEEIIQSKDFKYWISGELKETDRYYFKSEYPGPDLISIGIDLKDTFHSLLVGRYSPRFLGLSSYPGGRSFVFKRMPMGLHHPPQVFQQTINRILNEIPNANTFVLAHTDDLIIFPRANTNTITTSD